MADEQELEAHEILEQHISNCVAITGKAIRNAIREYESLKEVYQSALNRQVALARERDQVQALYDALAEERMRDLLEKRGSDAIVGAIRELTDLVRQAVVPQVITFPDGAMTGEQVDRIMAEASGMRSTLPRKLEVIPDPIKSPAWQPPTVNDSTVAPQAEVVGGSDGGSSSNGSPR